MRKQILRGTLILLILLSVFVINGLNLSPAVASGILPPNNPSSNVSPNPNFQTVCSSTGTPDNSQGCYLTTLAAIDNAIIAEGATPLDMPSNYMSLTYTQQLFVIANEERVARGLTPMIGTTSQLDSAAATGADDSTDPTIPPGYSFTYTGSNWAGGMPSVLVADYMWMYEDGLGSANLDCTTSNTSGCWGHRDNILGAYDCNPCSQGDGFTTNPQPIGGYVYAPSYAEIFVGDNSGTSLSYNFTWSQVQSNLTPVPTISSLSSTDLQSGHQETVYGANFSNSMELLVGSTIVSSFNSVSSGQLSFTVPQLPNGVYGVQVLTPGGLSSLTGSTQISIGPIPAAPTNVTAAAGNQMATVSWTSPTNYQQITGYTVNIYSAGALINSDWLNGTPPNNYITIGSLTNGQSYYFNVVATDQYGSSSASSNSNTVTPNTSGIPAITSVTPSVGPISGDTAITILGTNFTSVSAVNFGASQAKSYSVISTDEITAVAPAQATPGIVNVSVANFSGTSSTVTADQFDYLSGTPYFPLTPFRIMDTRSSGGYQYQGQTMQPNQIDPLTVTGTFGTQTVPTSATAVVLNVTVANAQSTGGFLTVYPAGNTEPGVSNINWNASDTKATLVVVQVGTGGQIDIANSPIGSVDVIVDVMGYYGTYTTGSDQGGFVPLSPNRLIDTRQNSGYEAAGSSLTGGTTGNFQITGVGDVPFSQVEAVVLEITVTNTTSNGGFLTVWPTGGSVPQASVLNWSSGQTIANRVVVGVSQNSGTYGQISVYNALGNADLVVDVEGYFTSASISPGTNLSTVGFFNPIVPFRVCDTRLTSGNQCANKSLSGTSQQISVTIAGQSSGTSSVPSLTSTTPPLAVVANMTAANTTQWSFLTAWPAGSQEPNTSDLNWSQAIWATSNMDEVILGNGQITVANAFGSTQVIVDVFGWYS